MSKIFNITKFEYDSENASIKLDKYWGSSTQISDYRERVIHNIEYMPSGELISEQPDSWATPYKFNDYGGEIFNKAFDEHTARSAELDQETGLYYYGAPYHAYRQAGYTPEIGIWLSVNPMSDKYPSLSLYANYSKIIFTISR